MSTPFVILTVLVLIAISAMCSGLNVALMSINLQELKRKAKLGHGDAKRVLPLRQNTHLSLSAILLTNVAAVSASSLVLESVLYGLFAGILSTLLIVIFGEILPQALIARRALYFMALFSPIVKLMVFITYPVSKLLQLMLDGLLKDESVYLQSRQELGIMISEHLGTKESELDEDEVEIIKGALQLSEKRVRDIMTKMRSVFWLTPQTIIDGVKINEIKQHGFSRIPVFDKKLTRCYGIILMKDLVDIDFDEDPQTVEDLPLYPVQIVGSMTALDTMFRKFISSGTHLLPIERDDEIVGIVTIEDLIEEIVGHEIEDETDRLKKR
ncbi:MAG: CNNM domain-containing protein [Candidatus Saccharimonadales bacterium]